MAIKVAVRHKNGKINHYSVNGIEASATADEYQRAREFVRREVSTARVILAVIPGGNGQPEPIEKVAA